MTPNKLTHDFHASAQITVADIDQARADGYDLIINNRPDGEEAGQPTAAEISTAARAAGIDYVEIPVSGGAVAAADLDSFDAATDGRTKVLAFCRTGTRSTLVRSMAHARKGRPLSDILAEAANGGYDISGQSAVLRGLGAT